MVVFVELDDNDEPPERSLHWMQHHHQDHGVGRLPMRPSSGKNAQAVDDGEERPNPNREMAVTRALGCYPYAIALLA